MKLHHVIAIEKQVKNAANAAVTAAYHALQKAEPMEGISRIYQPKDEEGEKLPNEGKRVQATAQQAVESLKEAMAQLFDVVLQKDVGNTIADASIEVDGQLLGPNLPVPYLLFLEKQLTDVRTFVSKIPTLDPGEQWTFDQAQNCYASATKQTTRTKKIPRNHVKAEATVQHPAQVEVYHEDLIVGTWNTVRYSGALPVKQVSDMLARVDRLLKVVKTARETANSTELPQVPSVGEKLLGYVFVGP